MSRRQDRDRPPARRLVTDEQAHAALEDLMPIIEELTKLNTLMAEGLLIDPAHAENVYRVFAYVFQAFREIPENSPAIDAYIRWLQRNTDEQERQGNER
jgi:hypothetical protein